MSSLEVHLTDEQSAFLAQGIGKGQFGSTDEAIRAAIDLLQREEHEDVDEVRRFEWREHVLFYRKRRGGIAVSRILHKRMLAVRQQLP